MTLDERLALIEKRIIDLPEGRPMLKDGRILAMPHGTPLLAVNLHETYALELHPVFLDVMLNVKQDEIFMLNTIRDLQSKLKNATQSQS